MFQEAEKVSGPQNMMQRGMMERKDSLPGPSSHLWIRSIFAPTYISILPWTIVPELHATVTIRNYLAA